jgi:hypothetical protein
MDAPPSSLIPSYARLPANYEIPEEIRNSAWQAQKKSRSKTGPTTFGFWIFLCPALALAFNGTEALLQIIDGHTRRDINLRVQS